ncbi:MAG TPA: hypothetical protein VMZ52_03085 [Bryobacteraceae bacterium]|nr:hypothetical protein [Bryobacteraceae bacterium]
MSSLRKSEAARINGAKSHGPKTPEGKAISSMNALRHGLCAKALVLCNEDAAAFEAMRNGYLEEFQPVGSSELDLLDEVVAARWRQCRGWGVETAMIDLKMDQQEKGLEARYKQLDEATRTAIAYSSLTEGNHSLDQIQRHDTRLSRMYRLALKTLVERQDRRKAEAANTEFQNEPNAGKPADPPPAPSATLPKQFPSTSPQRSPQSEKFQNEPSQPDVQPAAPDLGEERR